jgi:Transmembrane family 220, helix
MMRVINFVLAIMFLAFSFVQINDPDPVVWILIYGSMAVVCIMAAFEFYVRRLMLVQAIVYIGYAATMFSSIATWLTSPDKAMLFDDIAKMQYPYIEESREFLGLMICLAVLGLYWYRSGRAKG